MKTVAVKICPTHEAIRDKKILEQQGLNAEVVPHYKSPSFYVGDDGQSELLVREDELEQAQQLLGIDPEDQ